MSRQRLPAWFDAQYDARAGIPEQASIRQGWMDRSAHTRATVPCQLDLAYGSDASEKLDVFAQPHAQRAPVLVYIHGGYWRALDKQDQSFVAAPFVDAGAVVVVPNYALAPAVTVRHIVLQMVQAVAWVQRHIHHHGGDPQRIVVAGHSAGGHLAAMMLACRWSDVGADLPPQVVQAALALSGVFDLQPLRRAPFLAPDLKLSAAEARALSPALMPPPPHGQLAAFVGGDESAEFQRQNRLIRQAWGPQRVPVCETVPGRHHMNVLHDLAEPGTRLHTVARDLLGA
ncbi:MAG: alpha/beta hydrolase [Rubrivivax sp.]|nr:alpha/beta hydrolase [Rubrivivax sp.]MDP3611971.1 alpha/beta hydrolase [Rubrivivax sp.]